MGIELAYSTGVPSRRSRWHNCMNCHHSKPLQKLKRIITAQGLEKTFYKKTIEVLEVICNHVDEVKRILQNANMCSLHLVL